MVDFDSVKNKAEELVSEHKDQIEGGLDKAADFIGEKTGKQDEVDSAVDKIKGFL